MSGGSVIIHGDMGPKKRDAITVRCPTCGAKPGERCELNTGQARTEPHPTANYDLFRVEKGKIVYHIDSIHLKAGGNVAEMEARAAHLELMERAALEAQKRGQATFTLRGVAAGENFQTRFKQLAERIGVKRSARTFPGSTGMDNFEVQLTASKVLTWVKQSLAKLKVKTPSQ